MANEPDAIGAPPIGFDDRDAVVGRSVIDDQDFVRWQALLYQGAERSRQQRPMIVVGENDRKARPRPTLRDTNFGATFRSIVNEHGSKNSVLRWRRDVYSAANELEAISRGGSVWPPSRRPFQFSSRSIRL